MQLEHCLSRIPFYHNVPRIRLDVQSLLYNCSSLKPNVGIFPSPSGGVQLTLFYLNGVVPITYHGANYNIPVTIYFDPPYPNMPPRIFVTPTTDMVIKPNHRCVDTNGRVYLPQLSSWNAYSSNLTEIVGILSSTFSAEPPVNAVSRQQPPPRSVIAASPVVIAKPAPPTRRDQLMKSLTVKIRTKVPSIIKAEIDGINDAKKISIKSIEMEKSLRVISGEIEVSQNACDRKKMEIEKLIHESEVWIAEHAAGNNREDLLGTANAAAAGSALSMLDAESVVGQQVIDLMAEECAIEDLIDILNEKNRNQQLSMSELLREVRQLTRRLFEVRTLKQKCFVVVQTTTGGNDRKHS